MPAAYRCTEGETEGMLINDGFLEWKDVKEMVSRKDYRFGRNPQVALEYVHHLKSIKEEWDSTESFCKHKFFNFPFETKKLITKLSGLDGDESSQTRCVKYVREDARTPGPDIVLVDNDYPYSLSSEIRHMLVWNLKDLPMDKYREFVQGRFPSSRYDVIIFENPTGLKSVQGLSHVQVFTRDKEISRAA